MLFSGIPRVRLLDGPTPLEPLSRLQKEIGCGPLYVKRDDCMPLGMGGNKIRSLEFWLGQAKAEGADVIVVTGMPPSNQCRLAAAAAAKIGMKCVIFHNDDSNQCEWTGNLLLNHLFGAEIHFVGRISEEERNDIARDYAKELSKKGHHPYFIDDPATGALGYINAAFELHAQAENRQIDLRHIFLCGSAGPTEAGFIYGLAMHGNAFKVHLITVEYPINKIMSIIEKIMKDLDKKLNMTLPIDPMSIISCHEGYLGDGYAIPTEDSIKTIYTLGKLEGITVETTYNAKVFTGAIDLLKKGVIPEEEASCILHTGGTPAIFGQSHFLKYK